MDKKDRHSHADSPQQKKSVFDLVLNAGKSIGMWMIFVALIIICAHVFMRYLFDQPLNWSIDIATLFMLYITFLGSAWLLREDGHVSLDFLFHMIGPQKYGKIQRVNNIVCCLACLIVAYYGIVETKLAHELEMAVDMPLAPPKWIALVVVTVGFTLLAIEFGRKVVNSFRTKDHS